MGVVLGCVRCGDFLGYVLRCLRICGQGVVVLGRSERGLVEGRAEPRLLNCQDPILLFGYNCVCHLIGF